MAVERIPSGTYPWAPYATNGELVALSLDDRGAIIFAGRNAWVEYVGADIPAGSSVFTRKPLHSDYKFIGTFDITGREIMNSSASLVPGMRLVVVSTPQGFLAKKVLIQR